MQKIKFVIIWTVFVILSIILIWSFNLITM